MKLITTSIFALILSTPVVLADGCGNHGKDVTMSCAVGQVWNPESLAIAWIQTHRTYLRCAHFLSEGVRQLIVCTP